MTDKPRFTENNYNDTQECIEFVEKMRNMAKYLFNAVPHAGHFEAEVINPLTDMMESIDKFHDVISERLLEMELEDIA